MTKLDGKKQEVEMMAIRAEELKEAHRLAAECQTQLIFSHLILANVDDLFS